MDFQYSFSSDVCLADLVMRYVDDGTIMKKVVFVCKEWVKYRRIVLKRKYEEFDATTRLYWKYKGLKAVPKELGSLVNLKKLYLSYNKLVSIPKELGLLVNLKYLYLNDNNLVSIPKEIMELESEGCNIIK